MPRTEPPASSYDRITSEHHSSLKGDTTDLSCGHTRGALWQHKMSVVARQDLRGGKRQGNHKGGRPPKAAAPPLWRRPKATTEALPCHPFVLPPQRPCLAATDILCCHSAPLVSPHERSVVSQHPSPILQHPSPILQHPSASISMHHASSITQHASSIIHRWGAQKIMIFHFF